MDPVLFQQLVYAVVLALVGVIAFGLRELVVLGIAYLKSKIGDSNYQRAFAFSQMAVRAIEQNPIFKDFDGAKKKELAKVAILQWAEKNRLPIDDALIDKIIEAGVQIMNNEMMKIDWATVSSELVSGSSPAEPGLS